MGIALVPESLRHLKRTGVAYRGLRGRQGRLEIGALRRSGDADPAAGNFLRVLRQVLGEVRG
jgi:hypothetical protein